MRILSQERDENARLRREQADRSDQIIHQLLRENTVNNNRISALQMDILVASSRLPGVTAVPVPVVINLPELPVGTILNNRNGDTVDVITAFYIITPPIAGTISELAQTQIEVPKLGIKKVKEGMDGQSWLAFARALVQYWNVGGH